MIKTLQHNMPAEIEGVIVKISARAKRISMSFDARVNDIVLTLPKRASQRSAKRFILEHMDWIEEHRSKLKTDNLFVNGGVICVYGEEYVIEHRPGRGLNFFEGNKIIVRGREEFISRRVKDFLKKVAHEKIAQHLQDKIEQLGHTKKPEFRVVDPKTRWGSCTADGRLMFSWRLVLMPVDVLDYIVAHEVSHLMHMDHSPAFWHLCYSLTPDACSAKIWIKRNGTKIMGYR